MAAARAPGIVQLEPRCEESPTWRVAMQITSSQDSFCQMSDHREDSLDPCHAEG